MYDHPLPALRALHLAGRLGGIYAVCTSNTVVLSAAMEAARESNQALLVEATANQVNQSGGYTGLTPAAFADHVAQLAHVAQLPVERIMIGADHLGPHVWRRESAAKAMDHAEVLVRDCVRAGFHKIHIDTAIACADDGPQVSLEIAARRAARLCRAAEKTAGSLPDRGPPLYVIGTEVPIPGGGLSDERPTVKVTDPGELTDMLACFSETFRVAGLAQAWRRIIAVVVQPGVDFGDGRVAIYRPAAAAALSAAYEKLEGPLVYEVHAADYQPAEAVNTMVRDHFSLLKVGPCLTFALREALYSLGQIEAQLSNIDHPARLPEVLESAMLQKQEHWREHYRGGEDELYYLRHNSLRDRMRYYWREPAVEAAVAQLIRNLSRPLPPALLRRFVPDLYPRLESGSLAAEPLAIVKAYVLKALEPYVRACCAQ